MDPTYPLVPIINFLASFCALVPLLSGTIHSWNFSIFMLALWLSLMCFTMGVNTIIWCDDYQDTAPIWCDIGVCTYLSGFVYSCLWPFSVTHLQVGSNIAISASTFLSTRQLCNVIQLRQFCLTRTEVRKSDNYHHHAEKLTTYLRGLRTFNL